MQFCFFRETRVPVYHHRDHRCRIYIPQSRRSTTASLPSPLCSGSFLIAAVYLRPITMRRLAISPLTPVNFPLERSLYIGGIIRGILFGECLFFFAFRSLQQGVGMEIFIFFSAVYCVRHRPSRNRKSQRYYVAHGGILLALTTIEVVVDTTWGRLMWIDHRNDPGGPLGFYSASVSTWYCILKVAACAMANILGDGLLVRSTSTARVEERAER